MSNIPVASLEEKKATISFINSLDELSKTYNLFVTYANKTDKNHAVAFEIK